MEALPRPDETDETDEDPIHNQRASPRAGPMRPNE
jgi:hypothetical protein